MWIRYALFSVRFPGVFRPSVARVVAAMLAVRVAAPCTVLLARRGYGCCAIVGVPNIGKSTLFNALTQSQLADASNYPFCTIQPNRARVCALPKGRAGVSIPDARLESLARVARSARTVHSQMEFVDVAGLVRGASQGVGLGNQFLSHARGADVLLHTLRCFRDPTVPHVEVTVDPLRDSQIVEAELILSDLEIVERRLSQKRLPSEERALLESLRESLSVGTYLSRSGLSSSVLEFAVRDLQLLSAKPSVLVCHVDAEESGESSPPNPLVSSVRDALGVNPLILSPRLESELSLCVSAEERIDLLELYGQSEPGLRRVVRACRERLDLLTFYAVGAKEAHSWSVRRGSRASEAARAIHSDFEKSMVRVKVLSSQDYLEFGGEEGCQRAGRQRIEGRDYLVRDGDILHFLVQ